MKSQNEESAHSLDHHQTDLKEAIQYLPENYEEKKLCKLLKQVYKEEGKDKAIKWLYETKNDLPNKFDAYWEELKLTPYQLHTFDSYINKNLYDIAKATGWTPKALRHGKQTKKPPKMRLVYKQAEKKKSKKKLEQDLAEARERNKQEDEKTFIPPSIVNQNGACYFHPYMNKDDVPEKREDYLRELTLLTDCKVQVQEAVEVITERPGRDVDDVTVNYIIELSNGDDKRKIAKVNYENLTTASRFSEILVKHGFTKFKGDKLKFDLFHEFLINKQQYPTIITQSSWGEYKLSKFLFENGLFDVEEETFYKADDDQKIKYGENYLVCPSGSEQVRPPVLAEPLEDTRNFLKDTFLLWEDFNGSLNVRTTISYAMATIFCRPIMEKYNAFPLLFKFGERGTGKSTSMDWLMALFGYRNGNRQSVSKQNTTKSVIRRMTYPSYFPFFLDDYRDHNTNSNAPDLLLRY